MKKITQLAETGGAPIYFDDFRDVFNLEIWNAMEALLSGYTSDTEGVIVSGCTVGGSGPSSYTISAGIVFLDGEFMRLAAQTGLSLPQYIKADTAVNTQRTFDDTNLKTLYITKGATVAGSAPGAGQYVSITSTTDPENRRLDSGWVNITLNTSGGANYIAGARTPQYRIKNGVVYLRGIISTGGSPPAGDHAVSTSALPTPSQTQNLSGVNSSLASIASFYINTSGIIRADSSVAWGGSVVLDGLSYLV